MITCFCNPDSLLASIRHSFGGGSPFLYLFLYSLCVPVGKAGCNLIVGLVLTKKLDLVGKGLWIVFKSSHDHMYDYRELDMGRPDLYDIALSNVDA